MGGDTYLYTDAVKEDIAEMLESGWSCAEVAEHIGTTTQVIRLMELHGKPLCDAYREHGGLDL